MDIDFRPSSYVQADLRRRRRWVYVSALGVEAAVLLLVALLGGGSGDTRRQAEALEAQVAAMRQHQGQLDQLAQQREQLARELAVRRRLESPVNFTQTIASLADNLPASTALTRLSMEGPTIKVERDSDKQKDKQDKSEPISKPDPLRVELVGVAPGDAAVADVVERLANHALFDDVKLDFSRRVVHGSLIGREFRMAMQVPLDREYRPTSEQSEVAHAD